MSTRTGRFNCLSGAAIAAIAAGAMLVGGTAYAAQVRLLETGSSLLYPLFNLWVAGYQKDHPDVQITTQSTGSGTGIAQAISGIAQVGASDAYLSNAQMKSNAGMLNIPLAISSQMVNYNVPGLNDKHLKFSGPVLAGIFSGKITFWDDAEIAKLNPGVKLPHNAIIPVHRSDGSGDTFIFTQFLSFSTPEWSNSVGFGTTVSWPAVQGGIGAEGNPGMVNASKGTPYSIAYIGVSFKKATDTAGLGEAMLENKDGKFVLPDPTTVGAAVVAMAAKTPADERVSLIFAPGPQSYPIINYEYAIIKTQQANAETAKALKEFLTWAIDSKGGNAANYIDAVAFAPLPAAIVKLSEKQIDAIK
ncbi:MAG TPA: phosphate ABC transporter substrate-binding protein PstS [Xanthobacteraceae bacterium]|nr:phosphate ABC transporter substrate-binding protein PstS [Xanthobacteraceae bacterium]